MSFQRICYKTCRVAFCLVLQFTANLISTGSWFLRRRLFFILLMYFGADNIYLTDKISLNRIGLSLLVGDINYFLPGKLSVSKYTAKINKVSF